MGFKQTFFGIGLDDDAQAVISRTVKRRLTLKKGVWLPEDRNYLMLRRDYQEILVRKVYDPDMVGKYHGNSDEFPDCGEFALKAFEAVRIGAAKRGFAYAPIFAYIDYETARGTFHAANLELVGDYLVRHFEPQKMKWTEDLSDIKRIRRFLL